MTNPTGRHELPTDSDHDAREEGAGTEASTPRYTQPTLPGTGAPSPSTESAPDTAAHASTEVAPVDRGVLILSGLRGMATWSWRFLLVMAALTVIFLLLREVWVGVLPIILALLVSSVLWPIVAFLRRFHVPASLASISVILAFMLALAGLIALIWPPIEEQAREFAGQATEGINMVMDWIAGPPLNVSNEQINEYVSTATTWLQSRASDLASGALSTVSMLSSVMVTVMLVLVLTFFFLKDGPQFMPWVRKVTGRTAGMHLTEALGRVWSTIGGFLRAQAVIALVDAFFIGLGMYLLGVPLAFAVAVLTFLLAFIPILGAVIAGGFAVLIALVSHGWVMALIVLGLVVFVQQAESTFVTPFLQSRVMSMHPVVVLLGVAAATTIWGIIGAFLAVPIMAAVLTVLRYGSEHLDLRTGQLRAADARNVTPEGRQAAALAELSAPVFQMRARAAHQQAEDERGAAKVAIERTTEFVESFRDRVTSMILRRGEGEAEAAAAGRAAADELVDPVEAAEAAGSPSDSAPTDSAESSESSGSSRSSGAEGPDTVGAKRSPIASREHAFDLDADDDPSRSD